MTGEATATLPDTATGVAVDRLGVLFDTHHQRLYRLARRLAHRSEDARDLVQETFLRAARAPGEVPEGLEKEEAWLVRVLINLCRDRWRQRAIRQRLGGARALIQVANPSDPEAATIARSVVWHALDALTPRTRAVMVMHELEGTSVETIARTLDMARVTVRWHLSRGRAQIARIIRQMGSGT